LRAASRLFLKFAKKEAMKLGAMEIILILAVVLLLFGGKKIPELMKGLGKGMKEFKDASRGEDSTATEEKK
jgi:sec-independent protein translocase protein TatA